MITFAVVGHNEKETLADALEQAAAAAGQGDSVMFVDSGSIDGSADLARNLGFEVLVAPIGKGRAVRTALGRIQTPWVCLLDSDIVSSEHNIAALLAEAVRRKPASAMVLGDFIESEGPPVLSNTWAVYEPLVATLFPEIAGTLGAHPLTGFRAIRVATVGPLTLFPPTFGIEAHLNVVCGLTGDNVEVIQLGRYGGRFGYKPAMGWEIAEAVLDLAVRMDRLDLVTMERWRSWVLETVTVIAGYHGDRSDVESFILRLDELRARTTPSGPADLPPLRR